MKMSILKNCVVWKPYPIFPGAAPLFPPPSISLSLSPLGHVAHLWSLSLLLLWKLITGLSLSAGPLMLLLLLSQAKAKGAHERGGLLALQGQRGGSHNLHNIGYTHTLPYSEMWTFRCSNPEITKFTQNHGVWHMQISEPSIGREIAHEI